MGCRRPRFTPPRKTARTASGYDPSPLAPGYEAVLSRRCARTRNCGLGSAYGSPDERPMNSVTARRRSASRSLLRCRANAGPREHRARSGTLRFRSQDGLAGVVGELSKSHRWHNIMCTRPGAGRLGTICDKSSQEPDSARRHRLGRTTARCVGRCRRVCSDHGDGANRNDNKYIDNAATFHQVVGNNSISNRRHYPDVTRH
jgi:hypothetical protein